MKCNFRDTICECAIKKGSTPFYRSFSLMIYSKTVHAYVQGTNT